MAASLTIKVDGRAESSLSLAFQARLMEVVDARRKALERAFPRAMNAGVVQPGKAKLRGTIEASGFYRAGSLARGIWHGQVKPVGKPSLEPAAWFQAGHGRKNSASMRDAAAIVNAFEDGVMITVKNARYLAIPEGPAKAIIHQLNRGRGAGGTIGHQEENPVARVAAALGVALIPIISKDGDTGVLVADDLSTLTKRGRRTKANRGAPTPLFALVRSATLKKRPMGREVLAQISASFLSDFTAALARELGPDV